MSVALPGQVILLVRDLAEPEERLGLAGRVAGVSLWVNSMFSILMLYCVVAQQNAGL
jgi:hypothetical protein